MWILIVVSLFIGKVIPIKMGSRLVQFCRLGNNVPEIQCNTFHAFDEVSTFGWFMECSVILWNLNL